MRGLRVSDPEHLTSNDSAGPPTAAGDALGGGSLSAAFPERLCFGALLTISVSDRHQAAKRSESVRPSAAVMSPEARRDGRIGPDSLMATESLPERDLGRAD